MSSTKKIRFDYFNACLESHPEQIVDIEPFLQHLSTLPADQRVMPYYNGHTIKVLKIAHHERYNFIYSKNVTTLPFPIWEVYFTRSRPDLPGVLRKDAEELVALELEKDEYISEDTVMLYDPETKVIVMQRNLTGTPPKAMQAFFNQLTSDPNEKIEFQALIDSDALERALSHQFHRSLHFRIPNLRNNEVQVNLNKNKSIGGLLKLSSSLATEASYPIQAELTIKIPKVPGKDFKSFNHGTFNAIISTLKALAPTNSVDKLTVKGYVDESSKIEEVDLIEEVIRDWHNFKPDLSRFIPTSQIFDKMALKYSEKRYKFNKDMTTT